MSLPELRAEPAELAGLYEILVPRHEHRRSDTDVRLYVRLRARDACEYCLKPTVGQVFDVDHVIPPGKWSRYVDRAIAGLEPIS